MMQLAQAPWSLNADGEPRRIGVELEMSGLDIDACAAVVAQYFNLEISAPSRYERQLTGGEHGPWKIELDSRWLKKIGRTKHDLDTFAGRLGQSAEEIVARVSSNVVPLEVVSPPLPLLELGRVEGLIQQLRNAGAKGTSDSVVNAFGMQFNPDIPSRDPAVLTACLQAFLCLYEWLLLRADIDLLRRVSPYVDPFPRPYVLHVLDEHYTPNLATLIDDYLLYNPTRNRALDLLPLFAHLDPERVARVTDDPLIKPRPTFHYRLPDCEIHLPGWGLQAAWNDWVEVERLAADHLRLAGCRAAYLDHLTHPLERLVGDWPQEVAARWLSQER